MGGGGGGAAARGCRRRRSLNGWVCLAEHALEERLRPVSLPDPVGEGDDVHGLPSHEIIGWRPQRRGAQRGRACQREQQQHGAPHRVEARRSRTKLRARLRVKQCGHLGNTPTRL